MVSTVQNITSNLSSNVPNLLNYWPFFYNYGTLHTRWEVMAKVTMTHLESMLGTI